AEEYPEVMDCRMSVTVLPCTKSALAAPSRDTRSKVGSAGSLRNMSPSARTGTIRRAGWITNCALKPDVRAVRSLVSVLELADIEEPMNPKMAALMTSAGTVSQSM